jgi:hypothetical protein
MTMYCVDSRYLMLSIEDDKITFIKPLIIMNII